MNEQAAREVVLMRVIETTDRRHEILSEEDRRHASRSAREMAQWQATESGAQPVAEQFLQQRARLILDRLKARLPAFGSFIERRNAMRLLAVLLPGLAFLAGAGIDRIGDPHRVDLLSPPLLFIIFWNLLAYVGMLVWFCLRRPNPLWSGTDAMQRLTFGRARMPGKIPDALLIALLAFMAEWTRLSGKLTRARLSRILHLSAALFAAGAVASLYGRGFLSQYTAGWESTFLDSTQLHAILSFLFTPARTVFALPDFSLADIESLGFGSAAQGTLPLAGARWVHLYAATLLLLVIVPRLLLALFAHWQARRQARRFTLSLDEPYYRRLTGALGGKPGVLRVLPYSFAIDETRDKGLVVLATMLLGDHTRVMLRPVNAYGDTVSDELATTLKEDAGVTTTAVLFNLSATPEPQIHGTFLTQVRQGSRHDVVVFIDESGYLERLGSQAGGKERVAQRAALWQEFCQQHDARARIVNLLHPSVHPLDPEAGTTVPGTP